MTPPPPTYAKGTPDGYDAYASFRSTSVDVVIALECPTTLAGGAKIPSLLSLDITRLRYVRAWLATMRKGQVPIRRGTLWELPRVAKKSLGRSCRSFALSVSMAAPEIQARHFACARVCVCGFVRFSFGTSSS